MEIRCSCHRLLGKVEGHGEIKCPKCGNLTTFDTKTKVIKHHKKDYSASMEYSEMRNRATSSGKQFS